MSKKHFIELADCLRDLYPKALSGGYRAEQTEGAVEQWEATRDALADFCAKQNPQFNRSRWIGYINGDNGPSGGTKGRK
jgi:hypothetical protein